LPGGEVPPVERVGIFGRREAGILADRPRPLGVHRWIGAADIGGEARPGIDEGDAVEVAGLVARRDGKTFGGLPWLSRYHASGRGPGSLPGDHRKIGKRVAGAATLRRGGMRRIAGAHRLRACHTPVQPNWRIDQMPEPERSRSAPLALTAKKPLTKWIATA